jgi:LysR family transcriptional regulator, transcriptional activator of the cysJI operon
MVSTPEPALTSFLIWGYHVTVNIHHLETFVKIIELKSFTKAAEELYLTQPTVSKQIADLEQFFQAKLIDRTKRTAGLTGAGEILFRYAKDFLALKRETIDAIAAFQGLRTGSLRIGASSVPGVYILPSMLKIYKERFPAIEVSLFLSDSREVTGRVESGDLDIGFVGSREETKNVSYHHFLEDNIVFVAPLEFPDSIDLQDLPAYPIVVREPGSGTRKCFEAALKRRHVRPMDLRVVGELGDTEAIKAAVRTGMAFSYISNRAIEDELASSAFKLLQVRGLPGVRRRFFIIHKRGRSLSPQSEALVKIIGEWRHDDHA